MAANLDAILSHLGIKDEWDKIGERFEKSETGVKVPPKVVRYTGPVTWPKKGRIKATYRNNGWFFATINKYYYYDSEPHGKTFHIFGDNAMDDGFFGLGEVGRFFDFEEIKNTLDEEGYDYVSEENNILTKNIKMEKPIPIPPAIKPKKVSAKRKKNAAIVAERIDPGKERFGTIEDIMNTREIL